MIALPGTDLRTASVCSAMKAVASNIIRPASGSPRAPISSTPRGRFSDQIGNEVGRAMRGGDRHLVSDAELVQERTRLFSDLRVRLGTEDDEDIDGHRLRQGGFLG